MVWRTRDPQGSGHVGWSHVKDMPRASWGPACLPGGSVSFWSAFLCTMAGYVIVSLLLCSFRTTDRPVLDMRTVLRREKKPNNVKSKI